MDTLTKKTRKKGLCEEFAKTKIECPNCGRRVQCKTLQYRHACFLPKLGKKLSTEAVDGRRAAAEQRALEMFNKRSGQVEGSPDEKQNYDDVNGVPDGTPPIETPAGRHGHAGAEEFIGCVECIGGDKVGA